MRTEPKVISDRQISWMSLLSSDKFPAKWFAEHVFDIDDLIWSRNGRRKSSFILKKWNLTNATFSHSTFRAHIQVSSVFGRRLPSIGTQSCLPWFWKKSRQSNFTGIKTSKEKFSYSTFLATAFEFVHKNTTKSKKIKFFSHFGSTKKRKVSTWKHTRLSNNASAGIILIPSNWIQLVSFKCK